MALIDPHARWPGPMGKPDYAELATFAGLPYSEDVTDLAGVDVAIVGAPIDELVTDRPGARYGPRAIREASAGAGPDVATGIDPYDVLRVVDFGDAAVLPARPGASHAAIERLVGEVLGAGALPLVLGGDHSIAEPDVRACAARHGPLGLIHFDTHTDTAREMWGAELSHGTPMYRLVEGGHVDPQRYVQVGLRGNWPFAEEFAWQRERGIVHFPMSAIAERGTGPVMEEAIGVVGEGPAFASIDVDVLDPAFAPGPGPPSPAG